MSTESEQEFTYTREFIHRLKNNISAVKLSIKLLRDTRIGNLNSEQEGLINKIHENINALNSGLTSIDKYITDETRNQEHSNKSNQN